MPEDIEKEGVGEAAGAFVTELKEAVQKFCEVISTSKQLAEDAERFCEKALTIIDDSSEDTAKSLQGEVDALEARVAELEGGNDVLTDSVSTIARVLREVLDREPDAKLRRRVENLAEVLERTKHEPMSLDLDVLRSFVFMG